MSKIFKRAALAALFCILATSYVMARGSAPTDEDAGGDATVPQTLVPQTDGQGGGTSIAVPQRRNRTYFSRIDEAAMALAEDGSPQSLRAAAQAIRKPDSDYSEAEKVLLNVLAEIMDIAWPSESAGWERPAVTEATPYLGAIDSVRQGVYDTSTGNVDFFTLVLPSLVVLEGGGVSSYADAAEQALRAGLALRPNSVLANYLLGTLYEKTGRGEDALSRFALAAEGDASCLETAYAQANCLKNLGRADEAAGIADALLSRYPSNITVLKLCAEVAFARGDFDGAETYVARVLQQSPNDLEYLLFRARILVQKGDYIRAASLLDAYARQDSNSRDYLLLRAHVQYDWSRNTTAAVATLENALARYPNDVEVLLFAAELATVTGTPLGGKTAEELADAALAQDSENVQARRYQIAGLVRRGAWSEAYAASSALMRQGGERADLFTHIRICLETGRSDEAWTLVSPLYNENPSDEDALQSYILVLSRTGREREALAVINENLGNADAPLRSFLYYRRSFLEANTDDALADLRSSLIANPRNSDALFRVYEIYFGRREYRKAQYYLRQVVALNPNDSEMRRLNEELTQLIQ